MLHNAKMTQDTVKSTSYHTHFHRRFHLHFHAIMPGATTVTAHNLAFAPLCSAALPLTAACPLCKMSANLSATAMTVEQG